MTITPEIDYQFPKMHKRKSENKYSFMELENIIEEAQESELMNHQEPNTTELKFGVHSK